MSLSVIVLAAGEGKRMRSRGPKVLADLAGRSLLDHTLEGARALDPDRIRVVIGAGADAVRATLADDVEAFEQPERRGTGDAVATALGGLPATDTAVVLYGDVALVRSATLRGLTEAARRADCALLTVTLPDPTGYGRIVRDDAGAVARVVEERDAAAAERAVREVNTGLVAMRTDKLAHHVAKLDRANAQGEYYLTDVVERVARAGGTIETIQPRYEWEVRGVNNRLQLAELERAWQRHQADTLMAAGATIRDPARVDVRGRVTTEPDALIDVGVVLEGEVTLGEGAEIGPHALIRDAAIGAGAVIEAHSVVESTTIDTGCHVGPFARLRPGCHLEAGAKVGNFVEAKNARVGAGSKINHLAYAGDARTGANVNVGAGVITCNYDGHRKHETVIEDGAFIGSDSQLVAPVTIGARATIGAGSTITRDAPADSLTLSRVRQKTVPEWVHPARRVQPDDEQG
jgi:bifunctional UDP-N-acetylglucosamine pyrophosphorylase/glucosamine-1-phosphate N-acetyltransferase